MFDVKEPGWIMIPVLLVLLGCCCCSTFFMAVVAQKNLSSRVNAVISSIAESEPAPAEPAVTEEPTSPIDPLPLAAATGQYEIVDAKGKNPVGTIDYSTAYTCVGGCGSYSAKITLKNIRIVDDSSFVLDLEVEVLEVKGDPWLLSPKLEEVSVIINDQNFKATGSSFSAIAIAGTQIGFLTIAGAIPADANYLRLQILYHLSEPLEGQLK